MEDGAGSDEADSWDDLGRDACVISDVLSGEFIRKESKHRCAETDEEIGAQPGWPMLQLAFQPDQTTQDCREHQARNRDPDDRGHLVPEKVVDVLHCEHENVSWLDFITGKLCFNVFLTCSVNGRDYRAERCVQ